MLSPARAQGCCLGAIGAAEAGHQQPRWLKDQLEARASRMREVVADLKARCKGSPQLRLQRNLKGKVARYL